MLASSLLSRDIFLPPHPFHFFPFSQMGLATLYLSSLSPVHFWACLEATQALLGYFSPSGSILFLYIFLHSLQR